MNEPRNRDDAKRRRGGQSPQSKSRARSVDQNPLDSESSTSATATFSVDSSPGQGRLWWATKAGSPSIVSSRRACPSVLNNGGFPKGSSPLLPSVGIWDAG